MVTTIDVRAKQLTDDEVIISHFATAVYSRNEQQLRAASKELSEQYTEAELKVLWKRINKDFTVEQKMWVKQVFETVTGVSKPAIVQQPLSEQEKDELQTIESLVKEEITRSYIKVGRGLQEIRDKKLYREYGTFEEYVEERCSIKGRTAYQLMRAAAIAEELRAKVQVLPASERIARELGKIKDSDERVAVWKQVTAANPKPTAREVDEIVSAIKRNGASPANPQESVEILFDEGELVRIACTVGSESRFNGWWGRIESITSNNRYRVKIAGGSYVFKPQEVEECNVSDSIAVRLEQLAKREGHVGELARTYWQYHKFETWQLILIEYLEKA